ncbi:microfibrillar-associated protein 1, partial [Phenoliferia sp. Uapishka_3]
SPPPPSLTSSKTSHRSSASSASILSLPFDFSPPKRSTSASPEGGGGWRSIMGGLSPFGKGRKVETVMEGVEVQSQIGEMGEVGSVDPGQDSTPTSTMVGDDEVTEHWEKEQRERIRQRELRRAKAAIEVEREPDMGTAVGESHNSLAKFRIDKTADELLEKHLRRMNIDQGYVRRRESIISMNPEHDVEGAPPVQDWRTDRTYQHNSDGSWTKAKPRTPDPGYTSPKNQAESVRGPTAPTANPSPPPRPVRATQRSPTPTSPPSSRPPSHPAEITTSARSPPSTTRSSRHTSITSEISSTDQRLLSRIQKSSVRAIAESTSPREETFYSPQCSPPLKQQDAFKEPARSSPRAPTVAVTSPRSPPSPCSPRPPSPTSVKSPRARPQVGSPLSNSVRQKSEDSETKSPKSQDGQRRIHTEAGQDKLQDELVAESQYLAYWDQKGDLDSSKLLQNHKMSPPGIHSLPDDYLQWAPTSTLTSRDVDFGGLDLALDCPGAFPKSPPEKGERLQDSERRVLPSDASTLVEADGERMGTPRPRWEEQEVDLRAPLFHEKQGVFFPLKPKDTLSEEEEAWVEKTKVVPSKSRRSARSGVSIGLPGQWGSHILSPLVSETEPPSSTRTIPTPLSNSTSFASIKSPRAASPSSSTRSVRLCDARYSPHQVLGAVVSSDSPVHSPSRNGESATTAFTSPRNERTTELDSHSSSTKVNLTKDALAQHTTSTHISSPISSTRSPTKRDVTSPRSNESWSEDVRRWKVSSPISDLRSPPSEKLRSASVPPPVLPTQDSPPTITSPTPLGKGHLKLDAFVDGPVGLDYEPREIVWDLKKTLKIESPTYDSQRSPPKVVYRDATKTDSPSTNRISPPPASYLEALAPAASMLDDFSALSNYSVEELNRNPQLVRDEIQRIYDVNAKQNLGHAAVASVDSKMDDTRTFPYADEGSQSSVPKNAGVIRRMRRSITPVPPLSGAEKEEARKLRASGDSPELGKVPSETKYGQRDSVWKNQQIFSNEKRKLEERLQYDPDDYRTVNSLATLYRSQPLLEVRKMATTLLQQSLEIDKKQPKVWFKLGKWRLEDGDATGAAAALCKACGYEKDNASWWLLLGEAATASSPSKRTTRSSFDAFSRAAGLDPDGNAGIEAYYQLGRCYELFNGESPDWERAGDCYRNALAAYPYGKTRDAEIPLRSVSDIQEGIERAKGGLRSASTGARQSNDAGDVYALQPREERPSAQHSTPSSLISGQEPLRHETHSAVSPMRSPPPGLSSSKFTSLPSITSAKSNLIDVAVLGVEPESTSVGESQRPPPTYRAPRAPSPMRDFSIQTSPQLAKHRGTNDATSPVERSTSTFSFCGWDTRRSPIVVKLLHSTKSDAVQISVPPDNAIADRPTPCAIIYLCRRLSSLSLSLPSKLTLLKMSTGPGLSLDRPLRIAIVGAGPGGLAAAIFFSRQHNISLRVFEQATELREIGAGIHLQKNLYSMLELLGARDDIPTSSQTTSQAPKMQHRNGRTNSVLRESNYSDASKNEKPVRTERTVLQAALVAKLPKDIIELGKRLVKVEETVAGVIITLERREDGSHESVEVDLLVGADGIRSATRSLLFPDSKLTYSGTTGFRILFPVERLKGLKVPDATVFFHGPQSSVFTTQVGRGLFEISTRAPFPSVNKVPWSQDVAKAAVVSHYTVRLAEICRSEFTARAQISLQDYHSDVRALLDASPEGWKEYAYFGAPRLASVVIGSVALLGDASHPLSGAFGAGAGFAAEDAYVLSKSVEHARKTGQTLATALRLYDETRSPHYSGLYREIERTGKALRVASSRPDITWDEAVDAKVGAFSDNTAWIYDYDVQAAWEATLRREAGVSDKVPALESELGQAHEFATLSCIWSGGRPSTRKFSHGVSGLKPSSLLRSFIDYAIDWQSKTIKYCVNTTKVAVAFASQAEGTRLARDLAKLPGLDHLELTWTPVVQLSRTLYEHFVREFGPCWHAARGATPFRMFGVEKCSLARRGRRRPGGVEPRIPAMYYSILASTLDAFDLRRIIFSWDVLQLIYISTTGPHLSSIDLVHLISFVPKKLKRLAIHCLDADLFTLPEGTYPPKFNGPEDKLYQVPNSLFTSFPDLIDLKLGGYSNFKVSHIDLLAKNSPRLQELDLSGSTWSITSLDRTGFAKAFEAPAFPELKSVHLGSLPVNSPNAIGKDGRRCWEVLGQLGRRGCLADYDGWSWVHPFTIDQLMWKAFHPPTGTASN